MSLEILRAGLQTSVQDLGRFGAAHLGISASGASDNLAMRIGNLMVGNPENTTVIEMTLIGDTVLFHSDAFIALAGSKFKIDLDEKPFPFWSGTYISAGQVLTIGPTLKGARCYLCVRGGLQVKKIINSASTHLTSRMGGLNGSILKKGDQIAFGNLNNVIQPIKNMKIILSQTPQQFGRQKVYSGIGLTTKTGSCFLKRAIRFPPYPIAWD